MVFVVNARCDIVGRHGVEFCGQIATGQSLDFTVVGKGIIVTDHFSGEVAGWLPKEVAGFLAPMMEEDLFENVSAFAMENMEYNCRNKPPRRIGFRCTCKCAADKDKLLPMHGIQPAAQNTNKVEVEIASAGDDIS